MIKGILSFFVISFLFSTASWAQGLHIVFHVENTLQTPSGSWADFAPETIAQLAQVGYKISFVSDKSTEITAAKVHELSKLVTVRLGRPFQPFKVLGLESWTPIFGAAEEAPFSRRFRFDLQQIAFPPDTVLVDSNSNDLMPGQEKSLFEITRDNTVLGRQRLLNVMEVMLRVKNIVKLSPVLQYLYAVTGLKQNLNPGPKYDKDAEIEIMRVGLKRLDLPMQIARPSYPIYLEKNPKSCDIIL